MKNILKILLIVLFIAFCSYTATDAQQTQTKNSIALPKMQGEPKPLKIYSNGKTSVKAYDFEGLEYFLNQKNDTTYVVNFWATWCVPCVEELPNFEKVNAELKKDKVKVILVSLDMVKMIESRLLPFIENKQLQSQVLLLRDPDSNSWIPKISKSWSGAIPATVIYNKTKRKFYEQSFTYEELKNEIIKFK
ncbi:TlpA family protein disulfide reductase [Flavobacterium rhizosphaerae]|uniref:TlpA family protein disulfide reductase n=1 Tax=Flavobacterium rhizosphaerae TaxID=3163298 RepID=A0ABW8YRK4_9FLAO